MPIRLVHPDQIAEACDPRVVGGKAAGLARLRARGLPVPPWFVVVADGEGEVAAASVDLIAAAALVAGPEGLVAVRSSALEEDGQEHSFAGQFETYLNVAATEAPDRVARVVASGKSARVIAYRRERGLTGDPPPPAVIIQRMLRPDFAGVAFSVDPVTGADNAVVAAVRGVGDALVSGEQDADTFKVDRAGRIVEHALPPAGAIGLSQSIVTRIASVARDIALKSGAPQDIEWAVLGEDLHVLQARPVTARPAPMAADPGTLCIWDNSNITESYPGVVGPLTFSFARRAYEEVYRSFCSLMGVSPSIIESSGSVYSNMLGHIRGRVYYNLLNWYRLIAMLPGYSSNRRFMEQMMGVSESLSDELAEAVGGADALRRGGGRWALIRAMLRIEARRRALPRIIRDFYGRLNRVLASPSRPVQEMRLDELAAYYRWLERELLRRWDAPILNDFLAMIFHGLLRSLCAKWVSPADQALHNDLVRDVGGVVSVEPAVRIRQMAEMARLTPDLVRTLQTAPADRMMRELSAHSALKQAFDDYVARFGDRCLEELKLESPTLVDDPTSLLRGIGHLAARLNSGVPEHNLQQDDRLRRAQSLVRTRLKWHPLRRLVLSWIVRHARDRVRDRENLRFERTRIFGRVRLVFATIGRRLLESGALDDARDVFFLQVEEALGYIEGSATTLDLKRLASLRKSEHLALLAEPSPPQRFSTRGSVNPLSATARPRDAAPGAPLDPVTRRGLGCCAGVVRGPVRVIRDPRGAELRPGEVLVAERTDPGWVMLFPAAAGILVERGSLLSHSAIVSREMGIPGVVSIPDLTAWLRDGDIVEFDGSTGVVRRVSPGEAPA